MGGAATSAYSRPKSGADSKGGQPEAASPKKAINTVFHSRHMVSKSIMVPMLVSSRAMPKLAVTVTIPDEVVTSTGKTPAQKANRKMKLANSSEGT